MNETSGHSELTALVDRWNGMSQRQRSKVLDVAVEKRIAADGEPAGSQLDQATKYRDEVLLRAGMHDMSLKPESLSCSQQISSFDFASRTTRIEENTDYFLWSEKVRKDFQPFWANLNGDIADAGQVASGPAETVD